MYEECIGGPLSPMQTVAGRSSNNVNSQTRTIAVFAVLLFALSGLISGFAVGAFIHPRTQSTGNSGSSTKPPVVQKTQTPTTTSTPGVVELGEPVITLEDYTSPEIADDTTGYTFSTLIVDKSNKAIHASDVTCKLWLTKNDNVTPLLSANNYDIPKAINSIQQPFPEEIQNGLTFTTTQQVHACTPDGKTTWNFTVSPTVNPGVYSLVVLADWKGKHFNWSWVRVKITKKG